MFGKVFRELGINMVYGESGIGKTISTIKALNEEGITPLLLDFDDNDSPTENKCKYIHINGDMYISKKHLSKIPTDSVIIVDTWQTYLDAGGTMEHLEAIRDNGNTIIIIAHSKPIATKKDIPDMDSKYANHLASKLYLEYVKPAKAAESTNLIVMKSRGYKGPRVVKNWMRDTE